MQNRSPSKNYPILVSLVVVLAITIRAALYSCFPIFLTEDSGDYLAATHEIYYHQNFQSPALRDWRMPGYPVFLALTYPFTHMQSDRVVIVQKIFGVFCVLLGLMIGWQARSQFLSIALGLFVAMNPVYLLFEHMLLSESIFLFVLMAFLTLYIGYWQTAIRPTSLQTWLVGGLLGLISAAGILIRTNSMVFFGACILGIYIFKLRPTKKLPGIKALVVFSSSLVIGLTILLAPWMWRNYQMYNNISISNLTYRNSFFLKGTLGRLDTNLPLYQKISREIGIDDFGYPWLNKFKEIYPTIEAEKIAQLLLIEQIRNHPVVHAVDILDSFLCYGGVCRGLAGERKTITYWFERKMNKPKAILKLGTIVWTKTSNPDYVFVDTSRNSFLLFLWSKIGALYLSIFRPFLFFGTLILGCKLFWDWLAKKAYLSNPLGLLCSVIGASYIILATAHALTTAGLDRYATPFDVVAIIFTLLVLSDNFLRIRSKKSIQIKENALNI
jgi:hypothetical protein